MSQPIDPRRIHEVLTRENVISYGFDEFMTLAQDSSFRDELWDDIVRRNPNVNITKEDFSISLTLPLKKKLMLSAITMLKKILTWLRRLLRYQQ